MRVVHSRLFLCATALLCAACMSPPPQPSPEAVTIIVPAPAPRVVAAATAVFTEIGIPVALTDHGAGVVQSAPLTVEGEWGGEPVFRRVNCGRDLAGVDRALSGVVSLTVAISARQLADSTAVRLVVNATGHDKTAVAMSSTNVAAAAMAGGFPCVLTDAFARRILSDVSMRARQ